MDRREMTSLMKTENEAIGALRGVLEANVLYPPMWPVQDIRLERRLSGVADDPARYRWVVTGDYSAWP